MAVQIDISIKDLKKAFGNAKKAADLVGRHVVAVEKMDGTKLTLLRNDEPFDPGNYAKNWIVAYKGNVIYTTEFVGLSGREEEIKTQSIGTAQYKFVHDHLKRVHADTGSIPKNTEFFIEFIQSKPTVTRDYAKKHGLYLVGFGENVDWAESRGQLVTGGTMSDNEAKLENYREILQLGGFPVVFEGNFSSPESISAGIKDETLRAAWAQISPNVNFSDPLSVVDAVYSMFSQLQSSLGGQAEGVVLKVGGPEAGVSLYKALAPSQHDVEVRGAKKQRYKGTEEEEKIYWSGINDLADELLEKIPEGSPDDMLDALSADVYGMKVPVPHPAKTNINKQEDLMLTAKLRLLGSGIRKGGKIAVIPMAAKPMQAGHAALIRKAVEDGNDSVIVYVSTGGREELTLQDMIPVWRSFYLPALQRAYGSKVVVRFSESPMRDALRDVGTLAKRKGMQISIYGDDEDARARAEQMKGYDPEIADKIVARPVPRSETGGISGTAMRGFLVSGDKKSFIDNLPMILTSEEKAGVWSSLRRKFDKGVSEKLFRSYVKMILS